MNPTARSFDFVINNYTPDEVRQLEQLGDDRDKIKLLIFAKELGETGTPHLQCCVVFRNACRLRRANQMLPTRASVRVCRNLPALINYCKKTSNPNHAEFTANHDIKIFDHREQGSRTDIHLAAELALSEGILAVKQEMPAQYVKYWRGLEKLCEKDLVRTWKTRVVWIHGLTGTGKTRIFYELMKTLPSVSAWQTAGTLKWCDGYTGEECVLIDDFRKDFCTFHHLLLLLDRYPLRVQVKGSFVQWVPRVIFLTAPLPPEQLYCTREDVRQLLRRIDEIVSVQSSLDAWILQARFDRWRGYACSTSDT